MELTEEGALRAYARMLNTLSVEHLEPILADDFVYESQMVLQPLDSKEAFLIYITSKLVTIQNSGTKVFAEMGSVYAYQHYRPCVILAQYEKANLVGLAFALIREDKLQRIDLCIIPPPDTAIRSGEYPY